MVVGGGALLVFFGVSVLDRTVSLPLSRAIGAPLPWLRGVTGKLARQNAIRNPKLPQVSAATGITMGAVEINGRVEQVAAVDPRTARARSSTSARSRARLPAWAVPVSPSIPASPPPSI